jgi:hypothetical protein
MKNKTLLGLENNFIFIISEIIFIGGLIGVLYFLINQEFKTALDIAIITGIFMWINRNSRK